MIDKLLDGLNEKQIEAVKATEGYVRVIAGAGSGKTKVLTTRYVYLAKELGIAPDNILSVTYTRKAAAEMKNRIQRFMPDEEGGWITTVHGACYKMLKQDIHYLSYPNSFIIIDEDDQKKLLEKIFDENELSSKNFTFNDCLKKIREYKALNNYVPYLTSTNFTGDFPGLENTDKNKILLVVKQYLIEQQKNYYLDFEDTLHFVSYLLSSNDEFREKWQNYFEYIQVDEFQDISKTQYVIISTLSLKHKNLFVVGDPDQNIYSWRGARNEFLLGFDKCFENVTTIILDRNYRSTPEILNVSNSLIRHNSNRIEKNMFTAHTNGASVLYYHAKNQKDEAQWIAKNILQLKESGVNLFDIAVLYRSGYMTLNIEEAFRKNNIHYKIYNGVGFYQRKEIKDTLSYLRMLVFEDDLSFLRIINTPRRQIGKTRIQFLSDKVKQDNISYYSALKKYITSPIFQNTGASEFISLISNGQLAMKNMTIVDLIDFMLKKSGYESALMQDGDRERLDNLTELENSIKDYMDELGEDVSLEDYLNNISLVSSIDEPEKEQHVKMMTIHSSKGLEFPYVFVCCLDEGLFPSSRIRRLDEMEEERRVAYVAFTRAIKRLYLSDADGQAAQTNGRLLTSRFLFNIDEKLYERSGDITPEYIELAKTYIHDSEEKLVNNSLDEDKTEPIYSEGDTVIHKFFGKGIVRKIEDGRIQIEFGKEITRSISISTSTKLLQKISPDQNQNE